MIASLLLILFRSKYMLIFVFSRVLTGEREKGGKRVPVIFWQVEALTVVLHLLQRWLASCNWGLIVAGLIRVLWWTIRTLGSSFYFAAVPLLKSRTSDVPRGWQLSVSYRWRWCRSRSVEEEIESHKVKAVTYYAGWKILEASQYCLLGSS